MNIKDLILTTSGKILVPMLLMLCCYSSAHAETSSGTSHSFLPAHFGNYEKSLFNVLDVPDYVKKENTNIAIYCQVIVAKNGFSDESHCYTGSSEDKEMLVTLIRRVKRAIKKAKFSPAKVDGNPVNVVMGLQVIYICNESLNCNVHTLPNMGFASEEFGYRYISPQEIIDKHNWFTRLLRSTHCQNFEHVKCRKSPEGSLVVSLKVGDKGQISEVNIKRGKIGNNHDGVADAASAMLKESQFIPGFYEGKFVSMKHTEVISSVDKMFKSVGTEVPHPGFGAQSPHNEGGSSVIKIPFK